MSEMYDEDILEAVLACGSRRPVDGPPLSHHIACELRAQGHLVSSNKQVATRLGWLRVEGLVEHGPPSGQHMTWCLTLPGKQRLLAVMDKRAAPAGEQPTQGEGDA